MWIAAFAQGPLTLAFSLQLLAAAPSTAPPRLLPAPRELRATGGAFAIPDTLTIAVPSGSVADLFAAGELARELAAWGHRRVGVAPGGRGEIELASGGAAAALGDEGYELDVTPTRVTVRAPHAAGLYYGVQTLAQLVRGSGIPCVHVSDRPALRWRGVLEDLSRGPVPTLDALEARVRQLATLKVNLYALYFERSLEYSGQPLGARPEGTMSQAELRDLCAFADRHHVTIVPVQQSLGHMGGWLAYERYKPLADSPGGSALSSANPATLTFLSSLYDELAASSSGPFIHVGGDEAASMDSLPGRAGDARGDAAYLPFVRGIHDLLAARGKTMMIWGDGLLQQPARLGSLPKDVVVASWNYNVLPDYAPYAEPFHRAGLSFLVCPGAWNWRRLFPDIESALQNIRGFTAQGRRSGAIGQMVCTWGDGGDALFGLAWYPVAYAAAAAWQDAGVEDAEVRRCFDWWLFRGDGHEVADAEFLIARVHQRIRDATGLVAEPLFGDLDPFNPVNRNVLALVAGIAAPLAQDQQDALEAIARARPGVRRNAQLLDDLEFAARRIDAVAQRASSSVRLRTLYLDAVAESAPGHDRQRARDDLTAIRDLCGDDLTRVLDSRDAFERLWNRDNRSAGLRRVLAEYDADAQMWLSHIEEFRELRLYVVTGRPLPAATDLGFEP